MNESFSQTQASSGARGLPARLLQAIRSPGLGLSGEAIRFLMAGGVVAAVYIAATTVLADVVGLPFEVALIAGYLVAVLLHFTLQRLFVWIHQEGFALRVHHQVGRYLLVAGSLYGITALSTWLLPKPLGLPTEVVYLATAALLAVLNFFVLRHRVFHGHRPEGQ